MNIKNIVLCTGLLLLPTFAIHVYGETAGTIGVSSDYFWRGDSQNAGNPALSGGAEFTKDAFTVGIWGSEVDYGDDASVEYDLYASYALPVTDNVLITGGIIQYNWDTGYETVNEFFGIATYKNINASYYVDMDNSDNAYFETSVGIPFVDVVDVSIGYGETKSGNSHTFLQISKNLGNYTLGLMHHEGSKYGSNPTDMSALTLVYNFY